MKHTDIYVTWVLVKSKIIKRKLINPPLPPRRNTSPRTVHGLLASLRCSESLNILHESSCSLESKAQTLLHVSHSFKFFLLPLLTLLAVKSFYQNGVPLCTVFQNLHIFSTIIPEMHLQGMRLSWMAPAAQCMVWLFVSGYCCCFSVFTCQPSHFEGNLVF